jgi:hypothetical protein
MIEVERTPNPNSLKFTAQQGQFAEDDVLVISSPDETDRHPLGERLFAIQGVADVFITPAFVTVSKEASAEWDTLQDDVERALSDFLRAE